MTGRPWKRSPSRTVLPFSSRNGVSSGILAPIFWSKPTSRRIGGFVALFGSSVEPIGGGSEALPSAAAGRSHANASAAPQRRAVARAPRVRARITDGPRPAEQELERQVPPAWHRGRGPPAG